jgi:hypothetical protein
MKYLLIVIWLWMELRRLSYEAPPCSNRIKSGIKNEIKNGIRTTSGFLNIVYNDMRIDIDRTHPRCTGMSYFALSSMIARSHGARINLSFEATRWVA